jgi:thiol-disulfide isomerase/thioredoxin
MAAKQPASLITAFVFQCSRPRQCFVLGLILSFLVPLSSSSLPVTRRLARKEVIGQYLYRDLPKNSGDPIIDYYVVDPNDETNRPDFLYQENYSHHRVVEFYSPLCPHCVKFAPHYIQFASLFRQLSTQPNTTRENHYASGLHVNFYAIS